MRVADRIYHLAPASELRAGLDASVYRPLRLDEDGFAHCAERSAVLAVANDYLARVSERLLLLEIDPGRLTSELRYEPPATLPSGAAGASPGTTHLDQAELFPHVYGPIDRAAITGVGTLRSTTEGYHWPIDFAELIELLRLSIRPLGPHDPATISQAFGEMGWKKPAEQYERYLAEQEAGERDVRIAELDGVFAGYLTIVWRLTHAPFRAPGIPEIQDLNVILTYRRRGIATALLDEAERRVAVRSAVVGIGFGLHSGYGAAQRLYVLRGYVPDGRAVWYEDRQVEEGETVVADDDLVLFLTKTLCPGWRDG